MKKGKRQINIKINFTNRWLYTLIAVLILAAVGIGVYALAPGVVPNPGHNINQMSVPLECVSGNVLSYNGSDWICASGSQIQDIKQTTASHNGNFGGYNAMYNWIQTNGCSGYHVCSANEILNTEQTGIIPSGLTQPWFLTGVAPGYVNAGNNDMVDDCMGWTADSSPANHMGNTILSTSSNHYYPIQERCLNPHRVLCCK